MRTVLTNLGSMGDIQPLLSLAWELRRNGHEATLAAPLHYQAHAANLDIQFIPLGPDLDYRSLQRRETEAHLSNENPLIMFRRSLGVFATMLPQLVDELEEACRDADLLIGGHLLPAARIVHECTGIPFASVHINHFGREASAPFRSLACAAINPYRQKRGLSPVRDPMHTDANSPQLALYAISRYLREPDRSWPANHHITGFFYLDDPSYVPEASLVEFLNGGEPPVVIGFSSVVHPDPDAVTDAIFSAIEQVGCRAVVQQGWSGLGGSRKTPKNVHLAGFVLHTWLYPRASCVIHAGGCGSTGIGIRSGKPAVVVPHLGEQMVWAELLKSAGCAGAIIPSEQLTADRLSFAIEETLNNTNLHQSTVEMAAKVKREEGVAGARLLLETLVRERSV